jgi:hypothetical protein
MNVSVFQIYYKSEHLPCLDHDFIPYLNDDRSERARTWHEYHVIRQCFIQKNYLNSDYTGFLSWKFNFKTNTSGDYFLKQIKKNPGHDVYFINPFPHAAKRYRNVWLQGERCHKDLLKLTSEILKELGINANLREMVHDQTDTLYCNFWVGSKSFWENFIPFCERFYQAIENKKHLKNNVSVDIISNTSEEAFIMERLFSTFVNLHKNKYSIKSIKKEKSLPSCCEILFKITYLLLNTTKIFTNHENKLIKKIKQFLAQDIIILHSRAKEKRKK